MVCRTLIYRPSSRIPAGAIDIANAFPANFTNMIESVVEAYQKLLSAIAITVRIHTHSVHIMRSPSRSFIHTPQGSTIRWDYDLASSNDPG
jgi:hypothetical protein